MMNKKGQVLIAFVLLVPILILFLGLIIDMGYNHIEKRKIDNVVKDTITYGFANLDQDYNLLRHQLDDLINKNINDLKTNDIIIEDNKISITLIKENAGLFGGILNKKIYQITSSYYGYIDNETLKIIKE